MNASSHILMLTIPFAAALIFLMLLRRAVKKSGDSRMAENMKVGIIGVSIWFAIKMIVLLARLFG